MNVYLFRHGQKDSFPYENPDLTGFGHQQAQTLSRLIESGELKKGTRFLCSPRVRAQSTLWPASLVCGGEIEVIEDLDQRTAIESAESFRQRIRGFLESLENKYSVKDVVYLCTHHDWIEESLSIIPADTDLLDTRYWSWRPAQYMHFEVVDGLWQLRNFNRIEPS